MFSIMRLLNRIFLVTRIYGFKMAMVVPLRWILSNFINTACTYNAIHQWANAKYLGKHPAWSKTEHIVPAGFGANHLDIIEEPEIAVSEISVKKSKPVPNYNTPDVSVWTPQEQKNQ